MIVKDTKERMISMFEEILTENGIKFKDLEQKIFKFVCFLGCMLIKLISENLAETVLNIVPETKSYRKASETLELTINEILSHVAIRDLVLVVGEKQNRKEQEEISLMKQTLKYI